MCFKTMIGILHGDSVPAVQTVCDDVSNRDETFRYRIVKPKDNELKKKFEAILIIYSDTKKEANSRGGWFIHSVRDAKLADYFWVKSCKK